MKLLIYLFLFLSFSGIINAQNIRFSDNTDIIDVYKGATVTIAVDTAYVMGKIKAEFIQQKIKELNDIKVLYNNMAGRYNNLLDDLDKVQTLLEEFKHKVVSDSAVVSANFKRLMEEMELSLRELKENNNELLKNNNELKVQTGQLEKIVRQLRKETRGIWWNGVMDKIIAFTGGIGAGILLMAVL
jgi:ATP-dependent protease HslVU (ClpYQ) peptidase subunit